MVDPLTIATLITVIITGASQLIQIFLDYRRDVHANTAEHIYTTKIWQSNCCTSITEEGE